MGLGMGYRNWDENGKLSYECEFINGKKKWN